MGHGGEVDDKKIINEVDDKNKISNIIKDNNILKAREGGRHQSEKRNLDKKVDSVKEEKT